MDLSEGIAAIVNNNFNNFKRYIHQNNVDIEYLLIFVCWFDRIEMLKYVTSIYKDFRVPSYYVNDKIAKFLIMQQNINPTKIKVINTNITLMYHNDP